MRLRHVPPVYSPLSAGAIGRGFAAALLPGVARRARAEVERWLEASYQPLAWRWTDSGTSALAIALRLASENGARVVALPGYGCYDLATACDAADVRVHLYDVDPATLGPDWESLEGALRAGAGVIVVAHLYGIPVDLDRVQVLAERYGATVIEDAAQGIGGSWRGKPLGAHGQLSVLSFGRGKGITSGGGGALLVHDRKFMELLPELAAGGRGLGAVVKTAVQWVLARPSLYWIPEALPFLGLGETVYRPAHQAGGMPAGGFGVLAGTVGEIEREAAARRMNAASLLQSLLETEVRQSGSSDLGIPGYLRLPHIVDATERTALLAGSRHLGVRAGYPSGLSSLGAPFAARVYAGTPLSGVGRLASSVVTLPTHSRVKSPQLQGFLQRRSRFQTIDS